MYALRIQRRINPSHQGKKREQKEWKSRRKTRMIDWLENHPFVEDCWSTWLLRCGMPRGVRRVWARVVGLGICMFVYLSGLMGYDVNWREGETSRRLRKCRGVVKGGARGGELEFCSGWECDRGGREGRKVMLKESLLYLTFSIDDSCHLELNLDGGIW